MGQHWRLNVINQMMSRHFNFSKKLKVSKATGMDMSAKILKISLNIIAQTLTIFNRSLSSGIYAG